MIEKYYEEELQYLYESGRLFAREHPDRAALLNIDAVGDRDPHVERLFEGFAFLTARIREQIDDSFPQLTEGLIDLLWPGLMREIPSCCIVQLTPRRGLLQEPRTLRRGAEVLSGDADGRGTVCRFTTCSDVVLSPLSLVAVEQSAEAADTTTFTLRLSCDAETPLSRVAPAPLRLYIHAEMPGALALRELLTTRAVEARVSVDGQRAIQIDPATAASPAGFGRDEHLLPPDLRGLPGHQLLLEYFAYPEKFLFVDLWGFDAFAATDAVAHSLEWSMTVRGALPSSRPADTGTFRLSCTPAINLTRQQCEPVVCDGTKPEYRVTGDTSSPSPLRVHSLISVTGIDRISGERREYAPMHTFRHLGPDAGPTYTTRRGMLRGGARDIVLSLAGARLRDGRLREENLSVQAWCSNGDLPREGVREGDISRPGREFPDYAMITNITRPTLPVVPPPEDEWTWRFLSHFGATLSSLCSAPRLRAMLKVYDRRGDSVRSGHIQSITAVSAEPVDTIVANSVVRGTRVRVAVDESRFGNSGAVQLFGDVLRGFLRRYASINSFVVLTLELRPSGETREWHPGEGERWPV